MLRSLTLPVPYRRVSQCCLVRFSRISTQAALASFEHDYPDAVFVRR